MPRQSAARRRDLDVARSGDLGDAVCSRDHDLVGDHRAAAERPRQEDRRLVGGVGGGRRDPTDDAGCRCVGAELHPVGRRPPPGSIPGDDGGAVDLDGAQVARHAGRLLGTGGRHEERRRHGEHEACRHEDGDVTTGDGARCTPGSGAVGRRGAHTGASRCDREHDQCDGDEQAQPETEPEPGIRRDVEEQAPDCDEQTRCAGEDPDDPGRRLAGHEQHRGHRTQDDGTVEDLHQHDADVGSCPEVAQRAAPVARELRRRGRRSRRRWPMGADRSRRGARRGWPLRWRAGRGRSLRPMLWRRGRRRERRWAHRRRGERPERRVAGSRPLPETVARRWAARSADGSSGRPVAAPGARRGLIDRWRRRRCSGWRSFRHVDEGYQEPAVDPRRPAVVRRDPRPSPRSSMRCSRSPADNEVSGVSDGSGSA